MSDTHADKQVGHSGLYFRWTDRTRKAMWRANQFARSCKCPDITPLTLFVGLLDVGDCMATRMLTAVDIDLKNVRAVVCRHFPVTSKLAAASTGCLPLTESAMKIVEEANRRAEATKSHMGTEHLLMALVDSQYSLVGDILQGAGATVARLEAALVDLLKKPAHPTTKPVLLTMSGPFQPFLIFRQDPTMTDDNLCLEVCQVAEVMSRLADVSEKDQQAVLFAVLANHSLDYSHLPYEVCGAVTVAPPAADKETDNDGARSPDKGNSGQSG